ncbi:MAG TPA: LLM class F420-dependent oxidoreductase [Pseudonocardiaceae bacterium]|jgi:probable F420-dependent oxidoreductase|nr:LLM class F420-dependent oxidoreductase [Pseudonocardiaceae bacterium]
MTANPVSLGRIGVWLSGRALAGVSAGRLGEFAAEVEAAGYGAFWLGTATADLAIARTVLAATDRLAFATGILNIWTEPAAEVAANHHRVNSTFPDRLLVGIGLGHREANSAQDYAKPYAALENYLDDVFGGDRPVPAEHTALAALGPKVLRLAGTRTAGAHPYLVTPEHTRQAREILGPGPLLAPEHKVVLESDPDTARAVARPTVARYLGLLNYRNSLLRLGFTEADLADGGSDRLVDELVAWGEPEAVAARLAQHHEAGADHVTVQLLGVEDLPGERFRLLASALAG